MNRLALVGLPHSPIAHALKLPIREKSTALCTSYEIPCCVFLYFMRVIIINN
jgi:hypothetical protein